MSESQIFNKELFINDLLSEIGDENNYDQLKEKLANMLMQYNVSSIENSQNNQNYEDFNEFALNAFVDAKKIEGKSSATIKLYTIYIKEFLNFVRKSIVDVTSIDIRNYLLYIKNEKQISNRTLDSRRSSISSFLGWCCAEKIIPANPTFNVKPIKYERIQKKPLTDRELTIVREACKTIRDRALIEFLYSTGARVSEVITVKKDDVDLMNNEAILLGKGNKHRKVYLSESASYYLSKYLESRKDDSPELFVISKSPYHKMSKSGIEDCIKKIGQRCNLNRPLTPHLFRHTCATNLLQRGMDVTEIQKILGHADVATTMIYSKNRDEDIKNHHQKLII